MQTTDRVTNLWKTGGWMILACLLPLLVLAAIFVFQIPLGTVGLVALVLICPAMHIFMMRGHSHGGPTSSPVQSTAHSHEHSKREG